MYNIYYFLTWFYGHLYNRKYIPNFLFKPFRYLTRKIANVLLPYYFRNNSARNTCRNPEGKRIIVSLTSFPKRIDKLWLVIECLLRQTREPDMIILWLSKNQFLNLHDDLPLSLRNLLNEKFCVRFVDGDIRSHKKYYYAFKEFPNDYIITADDDIFYPPYMIKDLLMYKEKHDNAIVGRYCLVMKYDSSGNILPYRMWNEDYETNTSNAFLGTGGGTLFEPCKLYKDTLDIELAMRLTPLADDVWLNSMARLAKLPIIIISKELLMPIITKCDQRLTQLNVYENRNDEQIESITKYYETKIGLNPFSK